MKLAGQIAADGGVIQNSIGATEYFKYTTMSVIIHQVANLVERCKVV